MTDPNEVIQLERFLAASWPGRISWAQPSWEIRFADGYTKRANCLWVFDPGNCPKSPASFHAWKDWLESRGQPFYFKPPFHRSWDGLLTAWSMFRGVEEDPSRVMVLNLAHHTPQPNLPSGLTVKVDLPPGSAWLASYNHGGQSGATTGLASILAALGPGAFPFLLIWQDQPVGWAVLSVMGSRSAVASFEIAHDFRGRGWGKLLMMCMLGHAYEQGARQCALQVREGNLPAQSLYKSIGFRDTYGYRYLKFS